MIENVMQQMQMTKEAMTRQQGVIPSGIVAETEKRIYISNLDYGVSDEDIQVYFYWIIIICFFLILIFTLFFVNLLFVLLLRAAKQMPSA